MQSGPPSDLLRKPHRKARTSIGTFEPPHPGIYAHNESSTSRKVGKPQSIYTLFTYKPPISFVAAAGSAAGGLNFLTKTRDSGVAAAMAFIYRTLCEPMSQFSEVKVYQFI
jgi:hypothetical protein